MKKNVINLNLSDEFMSTRLEGMDCLSFNSSSDILVNNYTYKISTAVINTSAENVTINISEIDLEEMVSESLGPRRKDMFSVMILTVLYIFIFLTGTVGNLTTCIVIVRHRYMHTVTNQYLFNLAISDLLILLLALPPEVYTIWEAYPWRFGEPFCIFKSFLLESTSYASVLTITGFTIERYIAICHPIKSQMVTCQSRAIKCIICIWFISAICALPYPIHTRTFYYLNDPRTMTPIKETLLCNIPVLWHERVIIMFQVSTFAFFFLPMGIITIMYILIGLKLRATEPLKSSYQSKAVKTTTTRARKAVLRMLVAVVVAFFVCWAPFHAQRLMTLYIKHWTPEAMEFHSHLFYTSGVLYFVSSTVNPILYNVLSRKFRNAFKRTFCRCCVDLESFPTFYKLRAIFINKDEQHSGTPSGLRYVFPQKPIILDNMNSGGNIALNNFPVKQRSTKDTMIKASNGSFSNSGTHAHSDGRLHYLCRHKSCSSNRTRQSIESQMFHKQFNNASCQDIDALRKYKCARHGNGIPTFESCVSDTPWKSSRKFDML